MKQITVICVEIGYAYYEGNLNIWDTKYVYLPNDTPQESIKNLAISLFEDNLLDLVTFHIWLHSWHYETMDQNEAISLLYNASYNKRS